VRIAFFTDTFCPQINGVTNTLNKLIEYLSDNNYDYLFFAPDYETDETNSKIIRFKGIRPHLYPDCRLALPQYSAVKQALQSFRPDIIHIVTELGIGYIGLKAARELKIPIIMSYHTNFDRYLKYYDLECFNKLLLTYMRWFHGFALKNLCPSYDTINDLKKQGYQNLDIWSRGIDCKMFSPCKRSESLRQQLNIGQRLAFLYVGRISAEKGLNTLLESIKRANKKYKNKICFVFTGDGPYIAELKSSGYDNLIFTGFKRGEELAKIYASCDAFVFPSGTETFGNVVLEAMASGLPVVCVDSGGITDFTNEQNAVICKYNDAKSISSGIKRLAESKNLRKKLSEQSLKTAAERSWSSVFDSLINNYKAAAQPY